jgi:short-subunit dehydrogenase
MAESSPIRRVCILGAASAMAEATARLLAARGDHIALVARDAGRLEAIGGDLLSRGAGAVVRRTADLAALDDPAGFLGEVSQALGGLDAVLIFYGYLGEQARAEIDLAEAQRILHVNFTSAATLSLAAAARLQASAHPRPALVAIGSVAGDRGRASIFIYGAAKAGLAVLYQGLAHSFARKASKVRAVVIKAGFVDTPMTAQIANRSGLLWAKPEAIGQIVLKAMERGGPIVYAPWFWRFILLIIRCLPQPVINKVNL